MMLRPRSLRAPTRHILAGVAASCVLFTALSLLATLAAGTLQMDGDYPDGAGYLFLENLAPVRFYGILPSAPGISSSSSSSLDILEPYQVRISIFLSAIGYSWPRSPRWSTSAGIIRNIVFLLPPDLSASFPFDLALVAKKMRLLPEEDYACLLPKAAGPEHFPGGPPCANTFLEAWLVTTSTYRNPGSGELEIKTTDVTEFDNTLAAIAYLAGLAGLAWVVFRQVVLLARSSRRRLERRQNDLDSHVAEEERLSDCSELWGVDVDEECGWWWCGPCRGTQGRKMSPAEQRSMARLRGLTAVGVLYAVAQAIMCLQAFRIKTYLQGIERVMKDTARARGQGAPPEGVMDPEVGSGFLLLGVATLAAILAAWCCLLARDKLRVDDVGGTEGFMLIPRDEESARDGCENEHEPHDDGDDEYTANKSGGNSERDVY